MPNLRNRCLCLLLLACGLWLDAQSATKDTLLVGVLQFSDHEVVDALHHRGFAIEGRLDLQRDGTRTKLFVTPQVSRDINLTVFVISTNGVATQNVVREGRAHFGDGGKIVAWYTNIQAGVHFASGAFLHLASNGVINVSSSSDAEGSLAKERGTTVASFEVDPSGSYFCLGGWKTGRAYLGDTGNPSNVVCVATNFSPNGLFLAEGKFYLCGWSKSSRKAGCLILHKTPEGYAVEREIEFPGMNSVVDIDQTGSRVILLEESDTWPRLYVQSLVTGQRLTISRGGKRALFMERNPLERPTP